MKKPRIKWVNGNWICSNGEWMGNGPTVVEAYADWYAQGGEEMRFYYFMHSVGIAA